MSIATVSIVCFNNIALTKRCLDSVLRSSPMPDIILTDNACTDGTDSYFDALADRHSNIRIVHNNRNAGFIEPNLRALEMCESPYFICLNNDTTVLTTDWIDKLTRPFQTNPMVAITGPLSCASRLRNDLSGYRSKTEDPEYIEGSCMCVRTDLVRKHGLFSPDLQFAYGEDSDLGLRMRSLGYSIVTVDIDVQHEGGSTSSMVPDIKRYEEANHAVMIKRWKPYLESRVFAPPIVIRRQGAMGDVLLITPIIDAIAAKLPDSRIWVETQAVDLFMHNPKVVGASRHAWSGGPHLLVNLDMAYENLPGIHLVEAYRRVASEAIGDELIVELVTNLPLAESRWTPNLPEGRWVAIHCENTTWPGKNWPHTRWSELITWLQGEGWKVCLVGASQDAKVPFDHDLRVATSPLDLAAAIGECDLFIGHDSFPMHVAQSQGVPVIGLFGATLSNLILTNGSPAIGINGTGHCAGARHRAVGLTFVGCDSECMRSISVIQVQGAIFEMKNRMSYQEISDRIFAERE